MDTGGESARAPAGEYSIFEATTPVEIRLKGIDKEYGSEMRGMVIKGGRRNEYYVVGRQEVG